MRYKIISINYQDIATKIIKKAIPISIQNLAEHSDRFIIDLKADGRELELTIARLSKVGLKISPRHNKAISLIYVKKAVASDNDKINKTLEYLFEVLSRPMIIDERPLSRIEKRIWYRNNIKHNNELFMLINSSKSNVNDFAGDVLRNIFYLNTHIGNPHEETVEIAYDKTLTLTKALSQEPTLLESIGISLEIEATLIEMLMSMKNKTNTTNYQKLANDIIKNTQPVTVTDLRENHSYIFDFASEEEIQYFVEQLNITETKIVPSRYPNIEKEFPIRKLQNVFKKLSGSNLSMLQEIIKTMNKPILFDDHFSTHGERRKWHKEHNNNNRILYKFTISTKVGINNFSAGLTLLLSLFENLEAKDKLIPQIKDAREYILIKVKELGLTPTLAKKLEVVLEIEDIMIELFNEWSSADN